MDKHCIDCRWSALTPDPQRNLIRFCRHSPPTPVPIPQMTQMGPSIQIMSVWPNVQDDGSCAYFSQAGIELA